MAEYIESINHQLYFVQSMEIYTEIMLPHYGTVVNANNYFNTRLQTRPWDIASKEDRKKALHEASRIIDRLNFSGMKAQCNQYLQFPRGSDTKIPTDIDIACYEIALKLLDGVDPDMEVDNLSATSQGISGLRDTYNRSFVLDHLRAGVPSQKAWNYLRPYLIDPNTITLNRVD